MARTSAAMLSRIRGCGINNPEAVRRRSSGWRKEGENRVASI